MSYLDVDKFSVKRVRQDKPNWLFVAIRDALVLGGTAAILGVAFGNGIWQVSLPLIF